MATSKPLIAIPAPLVEGKLIQRYKRFLLDAELPDGTVLTAHCPNSGSLDGCKTPGMPVLLTDKGVSATAKHRHVWQAVQVDGHWVGINTIFANRIVQQLLEDRVLKGLKTYAELRREVKYGNENSRIDFLLTAKDGTLTYLEVKNVTLRIGDEAQFPDAVTTRGQKHLRELMAMVDEGHKAELVFLVQRDDCTSFAPADGYDPDYGDLLRQALDKGVKARAVMCRVGPEGLSFVKEIPVKQRSALPPQKLR